MTTTQQPTSPPQSDDAQALFPEARRRRRHRWLFGIFTLLAVAAATTVIVMMQVEGDHISHVARSAPSPGGVLPSDRGEVIGTAVPCAGPLFVPTADLSIYRGHQLVVQRRLPTGATFRFSLRPGHYVITNSGSPFGAGHMPGEPFIIRQGQTTQVHVIDWCE